MALMGTPNTQAQGQAVAEEAKKEAQAKHAAKVREAREKRHNSILALRDELKTLGAFDKLTQASKDFIIGECVPPSERVGHAPSFLNVIFGDHPAVGQSVTLSDVIDKTGQGMSTMAGYINKWSKKGIEVKTDVDTKSRLNTKYTITKLAS